jgi:glutamate transport system permease protein
MLPSIISQLVVILKDSALGYNIVYLELLRQGQNLATYRGNLIPTLIVLAAIYIVINYALSKLAGVVEQRLRTGKRGVKAGPAAGFVVMEETEADEGVVAPADQR